MSRRQLKHPPFGHTRSNSQQISNLIQTQLIIIFIWMVSLQSKCRFIRQPQAYQFPSQQKLVLSNKHNKKMAAHSCKENIATEPAESRDLIFHFCEKYAKRSEPRLKTEGRADRCLKGKKLMLFAKGRAVLEERLPEENQRRKLSNFEILKRKISYLENEEFLGDKEEKAKTPPCEEIADYVISGEFCSSKKITLLEKYRQTNKQNQRRKLSHTAFLKKHQGSPLTHFQPSLQLKQTLDPELPSTSHTKRRELSSQAAKRYFRPQPRQTNSTQRFPPSCAQILGRRVEEASRYNRSAICLL